ncbi:MAG TPA: T9SS type A sorting domain-containing protein [Ignavibacteria bacterium]|nr:T9SS type A sorting domain-containing protein [Ignavibacteria bacterium]
MKSKLPVYFLPVLALAFLFYSFTTTDNASVNSSSGITTLVIVHDSTTSTAKRDADRDTLRKYLPAAVGGYTMIAVDTNTSLPDLSSYDMIVLQETSFDVANRRYLGATARGQLKAWLSSGTMVNKKKLVSIGADQAYNYSRLGSNGRDLEFAETYSKFIYRVDNAPGSTSPSVTGTNIDIANTRGLLTTVPGGGYWPDGSSMFAGGVSLYKYQNHGDLDTLAAIGHIDDVYLTATMFVDPRYFDGGFGDALNALVGWVTSNDPLPVELTSFVATTTGNDVDLSWSTASEINNSEFEIERSATEGEWTKIGAVAGNGTTTSPNSYSYSDKGLATGSYNYRLKQIDFNGNFEYFNLANEINVGVPQDFKLSQNYPNPFNPTTKIEYSLPNDGFTVLTVFDNSGREVSRLVNEFKTSGYYTVSFDGSSLSSGSYFYRLEVKGNSDFTQVKKMILVK